MEPEVIFYDLEKTHSENEWRLLASPSTETKLQFSSQTWIYDIKLSSGREIELPALISPNLTGLLYLFREDILVNNKIQLSTHNSELVLFFTYTTSEYFADGMYSGKKWIVEIKQKSV